MVAIIFGFVYKYFFPLIITYVVGMFTKALVRQFGNDRAQSIKDAILAAMLWAEEEFGIGNGGQKWEAAWSKIIELLQVKGITLTAKEIPVVETLMKANVPQINAVTYSTLPEKALVDRALPVRNVSSLSPEALAAIEKLKARYPKPESVE